MISQSTLIALQTTLNDQINTNGNEEITGAVLNAWLNSLLSGIISTIKEDGSSPSQDTFLRLWRDTADNKLKARNKNKSGNPWEALVFESQGVFPETYTDDFDLSINNLVMKVIVVSNVPQNVYVGISGEHDFVNKQMSANQGVIINDEYFVSSPKSVTVTGDVTVRILIAKF